MVFFILHASRDGGTILDGFLFIDSLPSLRLSLRPWCTDRVPLLLFAGMASAYQHVRPWLPAALTSVLDGGRARLPLDQDGIAELTDSLLHRRTEANPGLERYRSQVGHQASAQTLQRQRLGVVTRHACSSASSIEMPFRL